MDGVEESKRSVVIPVEQSSPGNSEKNAIVEKEIAILVQPGKDDDSKSESGGKEGGGYASYVVSQSSGMRKTDSPYRRSSDQLCIEAMEVRDDHRRNTAGDWSLRSLRRRHGTWNEAHRVQSLPFLSQLTLKGPTPYDHPLWAACQ